MLDFWKKKTPSNVATPTTPTQASFAGQVNMVECENSPDFLKINFPILSSRSDLVKEKQRIFRQPEKEIDISVYFKDEDKYLVQLSDKSEILAKEYDALSKEELTIEGIKVRLSDLEGYDHIITNIMKKSFAKNYDKFQEGINNLEFFHYITDLNLEDTIGSRKAIRDIKKDLAIGSLRVIKALKLKATKQKAVDFLKKFKEHFGVIYRIIATLDKGDLTQAYELIPTIRRLRTEFENEQALLAKFECLQNCENYFETKLEELKNSVYQGLDQVFVEWDEAKFQSYIRCLYMYQTYYPSDESLADQIPQILKKNVKLVRDNVIDIYTSQKTLTIYSANEEKPKASDSLKTIPKDSIVKFLNRVYHEMSGLMFNTHLCCRYLEGYQKESMTLVVDAENTYDLTEYYSSLKLSVLTARKAMWQNIQKKIVKIFSEVRFDDLSYNDLLNLIHYCNNFVEIGEDFSQSSSLTLREGLLNRLKAYYAHFHNSSLQNLRDMISAEEWRRLPLPLDYKNPVLVELLRNFPKVKLQLIQLLNTDEPLLGTTGVNATTSPLISFVTGNPFQIQDKAALKKPKSIVMSPRKTQITTSIEDLKFENVATESTEDEDPSTTSEINKPPTEEDQEVVATSTANFIVKNFDKYLMLMNLIRPHALEIFRGLVGTVELFLYAVIKHFVPARFRGALYQEIEPELKTLSSQKNDDARMASLEDLHDLYLYQKTYKYLRRYMPKIIEKFDPTENKISDDKVNDYSFLMLSDLGHRSIAIESVLFTYNHLRYMHNRILKMITVPEEVAVVEQYYDTFDKVIPELRTFVYACFLPNLLKGENESVFLPISNMKWEYQEASETPNAYTDKIIQFVIDMHGKIESLNEEGMPIRVQKDLKKDVLNFTFRKLIDIYSRIKKFNMQGRNMMLNDLYNVVAGLHPVMDPRSKEKKELCENYIKAWFGNLDETIIFFNEHKDDYGLRELNALLHAHNTFRMLSGKQKKELNSKIENEFVQLLQTKLQSWEGFTPVY